MNKKNITAMLRSFMDNSVEILGKMIIRGLGVVSDRNVNTLELVIELGEIIKSVNILASIRGYIIDLMTPYAVTVNFGSMPRTFSELKFHFPHCYNVTKDNLKNTLTSVDSPPCVIVLAVRGSADNEILKTIVDMYEGDDSAPGVIVFISNPFQDGLGGLLNEIESLFSLRDMALPVVCVERSVMHVAAKQFHDMCEGGDEA